MKKAKKVIGMEVENSRGWIYVLPHGDCRAMNPSNWAASSSSRPILHSSLILDFLCLCTNPPVEGGIKGVEQQLEVLMTPSLSVANWFSLVSDINLLSHSLDPQRQPEVNILASFDAEVTIHLSLFWSPLKIHNEVKNYVGQVFEELDTEQANTFRAVDAEVAAQEEQLRGLRDDVMTEKKIQENLLKDMRNVQQATTLPSQSNGKTSRR